MIILHNPSYYPYICLIAPPSCRMTSFSRGRNCKSALLSTLISLQPRQTCLIFFLNYSRSLNGARRPLQTSCFTAFQKQQSRGEQLGDDGGQLNLSTNLLPNSLCRCCCATPEVCDEAPSGRQKKSCMLASGDASVFCSMFR